MFYAKTTRIAVVTALLSGIVFLGSTQAGQPDAQAKTDIVDTAVAAGSFTTLVSAVKAADLVVTLKGAGPFTVFAPTDAAFAKLPKGTLEDLLKPENKAKLRAILTYHVVSGKVMAADVVKLESAKTVNGQMLTIDAKNGVVMVDSAKVAKTDIESSNGVIHVIDTVMLPIRISNGPYKGAEEEVLSPYEEEPGVLTEKDVTREP